MAEISSPYFYDSETNTKDYHSGEHKGNPEDMDEANVQTIINRVQDQTIFNKTVMDR